MLAELRSPRHGRAGSRQLPRPPNPPEVNSIPRSHKTLAEPGGAAAPDLPLPSPRDAGHRGRRAEGLGTGPGTGAVIRTGHRSFIPRLCFGAGHQDRAPEPCTEAGHRRFETKPFTGTVHQTLPPELCTGAVLRSFTPGPCSECGAALRGRASPEQPGGFPHLRRGPAGTGETKIPTIEHKPQPRHRGRHPLA